MKFVKKNLQLFLALFLLTSQVFSAIPIAPEKVMKPEEIAAIHQKSDYFYVGDMDEMSPIWMHTHRQYGSHLLGSRQNFVDLKMAVHSVLNEGFPIRRRLEELYRARLGVHSQIGNVLPQLKVSFASNLEGVVTEAFSGLLGFLSPANWLAIPNQVHIYNVTKHLLIKDVMDEVLKTKLVYLTQHQLITDFEIRNFYFVHLQLLADKFKGQSRELDTLMAEFAAQGTDMASNRGDVKLGFDDLALAIALERLGDRYCVDNLNISDLDHFPRIVEDAENLPELYNDKEKFLHTVVERSIELKIIHELLKVSRLNIGITALGGLVDDRSSVIGKNNAAMAIKFGYGSIPNILISESFTHTAQIDVRSNYINMLDNARRSFDHYTNSLGAFTQAKVGLRLSRQAFKANLKHALENNTVPDALFLASINQLLKTELKMNNALHYSLQARARMDRYLLVDDLGALDYLPKKEDIETYFSEILQLPYAKKTVKGQELDKFLSKVHSKRKLSTLLYEHKTDVGTYTTDDINAAIMRNSDRLSQHPRLIHRKSKGFYKTLHDYISQQPSLMMPSILRERFNYPANLYLPRAHS